MHPFDPALKFIQATNYTWTNPQKPRTCSLLVVHSMEAADKPTTAEGVSAWFAKPNPPQGQPRDKVKNCPAASAHACVDTDSIVACVMPKDIAWACSASNWCSYNVELAGFAHQSRAEWLSEPNRAMLGLAAGHLALAATFFGIPVVLLDEEQVAECLRDSAIRQGKHAGTVSGNPGGMTTHAMCNAAWRKWSLYGLPKPDPKLNLSHWDPGPNFPLDVLLGLMTPQPEVPLGRGA
jgi:hypothetical protein